MEDLAGKVAVITGAASGIGLAMARRFGAERMRVVLADIERPALERAAEAMVRGGFRHLVVVDGGNAMGQIGGMFAMREAIVRARAHGLGTAAVRGSNHCGAMDYYAMQALPHDMIGIASSNALPTMAPWGGRDKIVGMNPLAVAIPAAAESPIVLDIAFAAQGLGTPFEEVTGPFLDKLGSRLAAWVDHHDHDFHERYRHVPDILAVDDVGALEADPDALVRLVSGDGPGVP